MNRSSEQAPSTSVDVFYNLVDCLNVKVAKKILETVQNNPNLETICIIGPAGSGKTTILKALLQLPEMQQHNLIVRMFDIARADFLRSLREQGYFYQNVAEFTPQQIADFNNHLVRILLDEIRPAENGKRNLRLVEVPAVGYHDLPRGQVIEHTLAERMRKSAKRQASLDGRKTISYYPDSLSIHLVADQAIFEAAMFSRGEARKYQNDFELKVNFAKIGINLGEPTEADKSSQQLLTEILNQASPPQIISILNEYNALARYEVEKMRQRVGNERILYSQMAIHIPGEGRFNAEQRKDIATRALYAFFLFTQVFQFPENRYSAVGPATMVAINHFVEQIDYLK